MQTIKRLTEEQVKQLSNNEITFKPGTIITSAYTSLLFEMCNNELLDAAHFDDAFVIPSKNRPDFYYGQRVRLIRNGKTKYGRVTNDYTMGGETACVQFGKKDDLNKSVSFGQRVAKADLLIGWE